MKALMMKVSMVVLISATPLFAADEKLMDPLTQCYNETQNITTDIQQAVQQCLTNQLAISEEMLNSSYGQTKASLENIDSVSTAKALAALEMSEALFAQFKMAECERRADAMMGGTGAGNTLLACQVELNRWRSAALSEQ